MFKIPTDDRQDFHSFHNFIVPHDIAEISLCQAEIAENIDFYICPKNLSEKRMIQNAT